MTETLKKGAKLKKDGDLQNTIRQFFLQILRQQTFDAVMLPMQVPSKDSFAWLMLKDADLIEDTQPIAPIMPVNAAKALKRYTRKGKGKYKIAALIKPCEVRATIELTKLNQVNLQDVTLFTYDCVGALPMQDYIASPEAGDKHFDGLLTNKEFYSEKLKPVCKTCDKFSLSASELHFAFFKDEIFLISNNEKGDRFLKEMKLTADNELKDWHQNMEAVKQKRSKNREKTFKSTEAMVEGFENLAQTFSDCIGCHNCGSSCPICYCRQCYFDTSVAKPNSDVVMLRAEERGAVALPLDRIMFHTGRMAHMSLSCVSCGLCSDACPVNIPVAQIFSYVASQTQKTFEYDAGASAGDALPMKEYKLDELGELGELVKSAEVQGGSDE